MTERLEIATDWQRVSPKYVVVVLVSSFVGGLIACAASTFAWLVWGWPIGWVALIVFGVGTIVQLIIAPRRARAIGYALRSDDLLLRRGIMFLRFVAVPYGRMQMIDLERGPVSRMLGLADIKFITAAAHTDVRVPGLPEPVALELRDRLVALAETRRAGL